MRKIAVVLLLLCVMAGAAAAAAQNTLPAIVIFSADPSALTVDAAETGTFETTLTWHAIHLSEDHRLYLYHRSLNNWVLAVPEEEPLEAAGTLTLPVQHPLDFGPPMFRLVLFDAADQVVDERYLVIDYEIVPDQPPQIELFTSSNPTIAADALADGSARINVSWQVSSRLPTSNLVFEQVLGEDETAPVELPRSNLWIASRGDGVVAPVVPLFGSVVHLRLRVMDVLSGEVYDESEIEIAVGGAPVAAAITPTPPPVPTTAEIVADSTEAVEPADLTDTDAAPEPTPTPRNCSISPVDVPLSGLPGDGCDVFRNERTGTVTRVTAFEIDNPNPGPGQSVTLSWAIEGAQFALLEVYDPQQLAQGRLPEPAQAYYDGLPVRGSTSITLPASLTNGARFILWAANISTEARSPSFLYDRLAYRIIDTGQAIRHDAEVTAFIVLPTTAPPGTEVSLSWTTSGADAALIELYNLENDSLAGVFEDLPTIGSASIVIPETFTGGARFVLWATALMEDGSYARLVESTVEVPAG